MKGFEKIGFLFVTFKVNMTKWGVFKWSLEKGYGNIGKV